VRKKKGVCIADYEEPRALSSAGGKRKNSDEDRGNALIKVPEEGAALKEKKKKTSRRKLVFTLPEKINNAGTATYVGRKRGGRLPFKTQERRGGAKVRFFEKVPACISETAAHLPGTTHRPATAKKEKRISKGMGGERERDQ